MSSPDAKKDPEKEIENLIGGAFITGVDIDVDQWREQTIEELQGWLDNIKERKTSLGDPLVEFPEGWDAEKIISQKQQFDIISEGIAKNLSGQEAREAQAELKSIRAQADKIRQLDKLLSQLGEDDENEDDLLLPELPKEDEDLLNTDIVIPDIDTSGPNPFELDPETAARLKEIDEKLGIADNDETPEPSKTMDQINDELLKLYQSQTEVLNDKKPEEKSSPQKQEPEPKSPKSPQNQPTKAETGRPSAIAGMTNRNKKIRPLNKK